MRRWIFISLGIFLDSLGTRPLCAQGTGGTSEPPVPEKAGKVVHAVRITDNPPTIDGHLDEEIWAVADAIDDLVQWEPDNMAPPSEHTMVQIAYDDRYLYVAARCYEQEPSSIDTGLGRRDNFPPTDRISIGFDPRHDHLSAYIFETNPSGVQGDFRLFNDTQTDLDYDGVWEVGTQVTGEGWTVEFRIPFSQMLFDIPPGDEVVWGVNVKRTIHRKGELSQWVGRPRGDQGEVSRWEHLVFTDRLEPPRRVEFIPFVFGRRRDLATTNEPEHTIEGGLELRLGLGTSATFSAAINPDFAQVELDPAVLNLTVFESFFPEKRPFFLEDSRIFLLPYSQFPLFHSRRIGARPGRFQLEADDHLIGRPEQTTILGAAKLTSTGSRWIYGALTALTAREYATVDSVAIDNAGTEQVLRSDRLIEPLTSYNVVRVQRDILDGSSTMGAIATAVVREQDSDAFTGGFDYDIRRDRNRLSWNGHWVGTRAPLPEGVRTGFGGATNFNLSRKHWGFFGHFDHFSPNFRNTDLGFHRRRVNKTDGSGGVRLAQPDPWGPFRRVFFSVSSGQRWNDDRLVFSRWGYTSLETQFRNFWNVRTEFTHDFQVMDDLDTRGGPPIVRPARTRINVSIDSDSRKSWQFRLGLLGSRDEEGGWGGRIGPSLDLQPSDRLQASLSTNYNFGRDIAQWITNQDADGDGGTDYVLRDPPKGCA